MWFNGEKLCQASYTELGATSGGGDVECLSVPGIEETMLMQSCFQQRRQKGNSGKIAKICDPFGAELSYSRGRSSIETSRTLNFHGMLKMLFRFKRIHEQVKPKLGIAPKSLAMFQQPIQDITLHAIGATSMALGQSCRASIRS